MAPLLIVLLRLVRRSALNLDALLIEWHRRQPAVIARIDVDLLDGRVHPLLVVREAVELVLRDQVNVMIAGRHELLTDVVENRRPTVVLITRMPSADDHLLHEMLRKAMRAGLSFDHGHSTMPLRRLHHLVLLLLCGSQLTDLMMTGCGDGHLRHAL